MKEDKENVKMLSNISTNSKFLSLMRTTDQFCSPHLASDHSNPPSKKLVTPFSPVCSCMFSQSKTAINHRKFYLKLQFSPA